MRHQIYFILASVLFCSLQAFAQETSDQLGKTSLQVPGAKAADLVEAATTDLKKLIGNFKLVLDRGAKIVTPPTVGGTIDHPIYKASIQKCVLFICETAHLDIEFSLLEYAGTCDLNFLLDGDLTRSSANVSDAYSNFQVHVCLTKTLAGVTLLFTGQAVRSPAFNSGIKQSQILKMLTLQLPAVQQAVQTTLGLKK